MEVPGLRIGILGIIGDLQFIFCSSQSISALDSVDQVIRTAFIDGELPGSKGRTKILEAETLQQTGNDLKGSIHAE